MAYVEATYVKAPSDAVENQNGSNSRGFKVGTVIIGGSCLVVMSVMAISSFGSKPESVSAVEASLFGLRASSVNMIPNTAYDLPGPSPWKELALAGIKTSNRCDRDVSSSANEVNRVMAKMAKNEIVRVEAVAQEVIKKATDLKAGQTAPMGFFDPLGFSVDASPGKILFFREAEIKHGRICMFASIGYLYGELFHPFFGGNLAGPSYKLVNIPELKTFWILLAIAIAIPEITKSLPAYDGPFQVKANRIPGDLGFDPLGLKQGFDFKEMQDKELNNGRLAMMAVAGMYGQEIATGKTLSGGGWLGKIDQLLPQ